MLLPSFPKLIRRLALVCALAPGLAFAADTVKVKLATLAPKDSSLHKSLQTMGEKWRQASGNSVTLTLFTDGTQGGEADMVRRMRIGQLHAPPRAPVSSALLAGVERPVGAADQ